VKQPIVVWLRRDLRLADNPALFAACAAAVPVVPVFVWSPQEEHPWEPGAASRWWLHHSLSAFLKSSPLVIRRGPVVATLKKVMHEAGAEQLFFNRAYTPLDDEVLKCLPATPFQGALLFEPLEKPYQVFTPFYRACQKLEVPKPLPVVKKTVWKKLESLSPSDLKLLPKINWDSGFDWEVGEAAAQKSLKRFLKSVASRYLKERDFPATDGSSRLSPHLHFGEISPRQVWHQAQRHEPFLRQIVWREFAIQLLIHFPKTPLHALKEKYEDFPWKKNSRLLSLWKKGETGYPIVDAGMRQLWKTGWMHNRVRMIVASFLVKDLLIPWQEGAKWFWDTLVDADLANNTLGWQWVAGCGADAAPFFRIFNPVLQGEKFDPKGDYVRKFVPELKKMPARWIHRPWEAPEELRPQKETYPEPLVDHVKARAEALTVYRRWT